MKNLLVTLAFATLVQTAAIRIIGVLFGNDYDENGCKPSAGYTWCNETQSCLPMNQVCSEEIPSIDLYPGPPPTLLHEM